MTDRNIRPAEFTMTFESNQPTQEIKPNTISIPVLIEALKDMDRGARAYAPSEIAKSKHIPVISLVEVRFGSLELHYYSPPEYALYPAAFTNDLERHNWDGMPPEAYEAARELHKFIVKIQANLRISSNMDNVSEFEMRANDPIPKREIGMVKGSLSLPGQIIQAGGAKPAIDFRLDANNKILHGVSVDAPTARMAGERLYMPTVIQGEATWNAETWAIEDFKFTGFLERPYRPASVALSELHEILGDTWSNVSVEDFMSETRGGTS